MREVRAIYHQGVYAVAAAFRQLYEMIEVEDERVHRLVAAANAAHAPERASQIDPCARRLVMVTWIRQAADAMTSAAAGAWAFSTVA